MPNIINNSLFILLNIAISTFFTFMPLSAMHIHKSLKSYHNNQKKNSPTEPDLNAAHYHLHDGIYYNNHHEVTAALNTGASLNSQTNGLTPAQNAALYCCSPFIFTALFSYGTDPLIQTYFKKNLLHLLIEGQNNKPHFFETIKTVLKHKVPIDTQDVHNNTTLHKAALFYTESATLGKAPYYHPNHKKTASRYYHAIKLLLFAGANHETKNNKNKTALDLIHPKNKSSIERLINMQHFFSLPKNLSDLLLSHIQTPNICAIILNYLSPSDTTEKEQKLWDELTPIRQIQQQLLITTSNELTEEKKY